MAVYLFSFHAYRSWMPDRRRGYVRKKKGVLPPDPEVARRYAQNAQEPEMEFTPEIQQAMIEIVRQMCLHKRWRLHQVVVDPTHTHALISWHGFLKADSAKRTMHYKLTNGLRGRFASGRKYLSENGSKKRVRDRRHFEYLMNVYLPKHDRHGSYWREDQRQAGDPGDPA